MAIPLVSRCGAIVLLIGVGLSPSGSVSAAGRRDRQIESFSLGIARGQTLRVTAFNGLRPAVRDPKGGRLRVLVAPLIFDQDGNLLAEADEIAVEPGETHSFDFNRDGLALAGDSGTGRLQVRGEIRYRLFSIVDRTQMAWNSVSASLEILDGTTGETTAYANPRAFQIVSAGRNSGRSGAQALVGSATSSARLSPVGLVPGQTLRICGANRATPGHPDLYLNIWVESPAGSRVFDVTFAVQTAQTRCADLDRDAIGLTGEPGTGRLQLASGVTFAGGPPPDSVLVSGEVVSAETGETQLGLLLPAVQRVRD
jgi:hypothetical protein